MDIEDAIKICKEEITNTYAENKAIAIDTILNTMYRAIEESAYYRDLVRLTRKEKQQLKKSLKGQINKQNKIINLMAERLAEDKEWFYSEFDNYTKQDFIEYFTNKVEEDTKE